MQLLGGTPLPGGLAVLTRGGFLLSGDWVQCSQRFWSELAGLGDRFGFLILL